MNLRTKFVLALVGISVLATAAIGIFSYRITRSELTGEVDSSLRDAVLQLQRPGGADRFVPSGRSFRGRSDVMVQVLDGAGDVFPLTGAQLPISDADRELATGGGDALVRDVATDGGPVRMITVPLRNGSGAVQVARSLVETDQVLSGLRRRIVIASVVVVGVAAALGMLLARGLTRRLVRLTGVAEQVRSTRSLDVEVPVAGRDETGRLGAAFQDMLSSLARSRDDQQRLVQDVGHELRTPLTSLRTNVFTLRRGDVVDPAVRDRVLDDIDSETQELARLVDEVVEVATDRRGDEPEVPVDLGDLVERVAERARQRSGRPVVVHRDTALVLDGRPIALERAVGNLVENALKFDDTGGPIDVTCEGTRVEVADRGPGIPPDERALVFERFHRSDTARSRPGSGLGLSIVREIVERHGGRVFVADRAGGGAIVGFVLPSSTGG
ncbi:MAG: HAMP domain-containing histidine kinase [Actinobacteria bacterium]|nr:HAMP domain-containing histidine kinase [Actinomycetota bacterium]